MRNELQFHLNQLTAWLVSRAEPLAHSHILIAEDADVFHGETINVPRRALAAPDEYASRFEAHVRAEYSWINLHAAGIIDDTLLVIIELPREANAVLCGQTSVNLSGPCCGRFAIAIT